MNDILPAVLTVVGVLGGIAALLFLLAALDPTSEWAGSPARATPRGRTGARAPIAPQ